MNIFRLRRELSQQHALTKAKKARMQASIKLVRQQAHDTVTSPKTIVGSFLAGAAVGWISIEPNSHQPADESVCKGKDSCSHGLESHEDGAAVSQQASCFAENLDRFIGLGLSMIAAELSQSTAGALKSLLLNTQQEQRDEMDSAVVRNGIESTPISR